MLTSYFRCLLPGFGRFPWLQFNQTLFLLLSKKQYCLFEPPYLSHLRRKPTNWHVRPAKTKISLSIRPVWSESSLSAWRNIGSLATHWAHSECFDQTGRMPRLIWVFAGCTCHFVGFVTGRLICLMFHNIIQSINSKWCNVSLACHIWES